MDEMNKEKMIVNQYNNYSVYIDRLNSLYLQLCIKRIQTEDLNRDEYMLYDMFDALIHLVAALDEVVGKEHPYPGYVVEKLARVKSYVDTTYNYFVGRSNKDES